MTDIEPKAQEHHGETDDYTGNSDLKPRHLKFGRNFIAAADHAANNHEYEADEHHEDAGSLKALYLFPVEYRNEDEESQNPAGDQPHCKTLSVGTCDCRECTLQSVI